MNPYLVLALPARRQRPSSSPCSATPASWPRRPHTESLYKDPAGAFTLMVPANWETLRDPGSRMVSFANEKS